MAATLGLVIYTAMPGVPANAQNLETAALAPRSDRAELPTILSDSDADLYARIFDLQRDGQWKQADRLIKQISDPVLMGHVLFQRYMHPTAYRSQFKELQTWMAAYADHPGATRIYELAKRRQPAGSKAPNRPRAVELPAMDAVLEASDSDGEVTTPNRPHSRKYAGKTRAQRSQIKAEQRRIRSLVQRGNVTAALERLSQHAMQRLFDPVSYAESLGVIARGYYRYHYDDKALEAAADAEKAAGEEAALAHWWGGLAAYRSGDWEQAAKHFEQLSRSAEADSWRRAAGGFWASRAYLRAGQPEQVSAMLDRAADYPMTFYGLLAIRGLGEAPPLDFHLPVLSSTDTDFLMRIPAARRAIALIEAGQTDLADAELRRFVDQLPPSFAATMLAFADRAGLADVAFRMGREMEREQGVTLHGALYPVPGWMPEDGYDIDRALIFAIVRQESQFRARATSRAGARGLMQLMPATAGFMAGTRFRGSAKASLYDPSLNLSLGQKYIHHVLDLKEVDNSLLYALAAYNAGPGNLQRWRAKIDYNNDPLLFIESLPSRETRNYVEFVLSNFWIYRLRLGQSLSSMDQLIGGAWPVYIAQDGAAPDIRQIDVSFE